MVIRYVCGHYCTMIDKKYSRLMVRIADQSIKPELDLACLITGTRFDSDQDDLRPG